MRVVSPPCTPCRVAVGMAAEVGGFGRLSGTFRPPLATTDTALTCY